MDVKPSKLLQRGLGAHAADYRKGRTCETHGFGIGAFAYYRQILEKIIDGLLKDLEMFFSDDASLKKYQEELSKVQDGQNATAKIRIAKDLLPRQLQIEGENPLGRLYGVLSEGRHSGTDERCLELAELVRIVLVHLVEKVEFDKESGREITKSLSQIKQQLDKQIEKKSQ